MPFRPPVGGLAVAEFADRVTRDQFADALNAACIPWHWHPAAPGDRIVRVQWQQIEFVFAGEGAETVLWSAGAWSGPYECLSPAKHPPVSRSDWPIHLPPNPDAPRETQVTGPTAVSTRRPT